MAAGSKSLFASFSSEKEDSVFFEKKNQKTFASFAASLVAKPSFRKFATKFPFTRPIARKNTRALFDICAGFVYAQILSACLQLQVFDILAAGPQRAAALAPRLRLTEDAASRLLDGAAALGLLHRRRDGAYALAQLGAALIDNEGIAAMVAHHAMFYGDMADPVALLRGETSPALREYWAYARATRPEGATPEQVDAYSRLMAASQPLVADEILDAYDVRRHRVLLDVGGGEGVFLEAAARRAPGLQLRLFDLPPVAARAERRFAEVGISGRARAFGGSFLADALPDGADLISLVRVVHDHDDANVMILLQAVRAALAPGGTLLLGEPLAGTKGAERMGDAYFGFYLLAMGSGRPRRAETLTAMLHEAGFAQVRLHATHTPLLTSVLTARVA
jgi:demethylspheroidene O-methyltransferase